MVNPTRTKRLEIRAVDTEVLVHDPDHDRVHVLNRTAGIILDLCDGTRSSTQIAQELSKATGADIAVVSRDVDAIVHDFANLKLVD